MLNVDKSSTISPEGKLDTCGSVSLSHFSHLQQVKDCRKYDIRELVLSGIGRKRGKGEEDSVPQLRKMVD